MSKASKGRDPMLMRGHKRRPRTSKPPEKAEIFAPQKFSDGSASLPLTSKERECIVTMIDFFRSSGEEEHLDPEVYEAIAEKLGAGREKASPLNELRAHLKWLESTLWELGTETVGIEQKNGTISIDPNSTQYELHACARKAREAFDALSLIKPVSVVADVLTAMGPVLGAIDGVLDADGYEATDCSSCECEEFEASSKGLTCAHTEARNAQRNLRAALREAGFVEDNFGAWGTP